ncbi:MAG: tetratricopeptide repeat protein, partial [Bacteroidales bacterium]|nr:tetratricopeptide repeat protein [Bacteroidales bacterium]
DNIFSSFASKAKGEEVREKTEQEIVDEFCTETLAQIYIDQGYYEQAKFIYSKLLLRYPEKNAYFAALIQKLG